MGLRKRRREAAVFRMGLGGMMAAVALSFSACAPQQPPVDVDALEARLTANIEARIRAEKEAAEAQKKLEEAEELRKLEASRRAEQTAKVEERLKQEAVRRKEAEKKLRLRREEEKKRTAERNRRKAEEQRALEKKNKTEFLSLQSSIQDMTTRTEEVNAFAADLEEQFDDWKIKEWDADLTRIRSELADAPNGLQKIAAALKRMSTKPASPTDFDELRARIAEEARKLDDIEANLTVQEEGLTQHKITEVSDLQQIIQETDQGISDSVVKLDFLRQGFAEHETDQWNQDLKRIESVFERARENLEALVGAFPPLLEEPADISPDALTPLRIAIGQEYRAVGRQEKELISIERELEKTIEKSNQEALVDDATKIKQEISEVENIIEKSEEKLEELKTQQKELQINRWTKELEKIDFGLAEMHDDMRNVDQDLASSRRDSDGISADALAILKRQVDKASEGANSLQDDLTDIETSLDGMTKGIVTPLPEGMTSRLRMWPGFKPTDWSDYRSELREFLSQRSDEIRRFIEDAY